MIISLLKSKFLLKQFQRINIYGMDAFQCCYLGNQYPRTFKLFIKISLGEIFQFVNEYTLPLVIGT